MLWCASLIWFKTAWSLAETSFEGVDQRQGGPQHNLEFLRRREGWCHCLRDFWRIATAGLPDCHSMVVFCTVDITMFFSLAKCFFYEFPNFNVIYSFCTSVYVGYLGLSRFWRPGGMPWVFCPCQSAPCQAEADRVPRALRALRWCADAAALEFQSIAWCHGRLSSRRIQALGMLEGHRTMFNHIWWSFLNVVLYFNKNVQNVFELSVSTWIGFGTFRFLRTRSFLGTGWLLRRLVAKRSQPRSTSASRVGSSGQRLARRVVDVRAPQHLRGEIYAWNWHIFCWELIFLHCKFNVSGCHDVLISSCHATRWTLLHPRQAISRTRVPWLCATESNQENATSLSLLEYDLHHLPGWFNTFRTFWNMETSWMIPVCKESLSSMHCKMAIWMLHGPKLSNRDATSKRHNLEVLLKRKIFHFAVPTKVTIWTWVAHMITFEIIVSLCDRWWLLGKYGRTRPPSWTRLCRC